MNRYQEAMFKAYWFPVALFYVFPNIILMLVAWPISFIDIAQNFLPFIVALFVSGYILSPIFGPKVTQNKGWSFFMAFVCMLISLLAFIGSMGGLSVENLSFSLGIIWLLALFGVFPALLGGIFFIGACNEISNCT